MNAIDPQGVVDSLPKSQRWEYGGYPYGLEPLALPIQRRPTTTLNDTAAFSRICALLSARSLHVDLDRYLRPADAEDIDRIFWFRWITGHQVTFTLWQLLASTVDIARGHANAYPPEVETLVGDARLLVRGCSLMLLYASSPTREIYDRVIRGPMCRLHRNLSGSWASDYRPVRSLLRGVIEFGTGAEATALLRECALNEKVHQGIATKLVPSGVSLLQSAPVTGALRRQRRETLSWLYDGIFLTSRVQVSYETVVRQLVRRLHAVVLDLRVNGLYPDFAPSHGDEPPELRDADVVNCKETSVEKLLDILEFAGGCRDTPREFGWVSVRSPSPGRSSHDDPA